MRVVFDCRSVFDGMGGIGRAAASFARELPRALPDAELIVLTGARRPDRPIVEAPNAREVAVPAAMIDPVFEQVTLPGLLEELRADLYHNLAFAVPIASGRTRTVATVFDVVFRRRPELVSPWLREYLDHWTGVTCTVADAVLTASEFSRREIQSVYGRRAEVIPIGVDRAFFSLSRLAAREPFVLYVGSFEEKKNVLPLLRAFAAFRHHAPELPHHLLLVGGGPFDFEGTFAREPALAERVVIKGHVPEEALHSAYAAADAFLYLSEYEGFGLPPLEAMAARVPAIVSDRGSLPEVTAGGALIANPDDPEEVGLKLARILRHAHAREDLAHRGRAVAERYTWEETAAATAAVYRRLLEAPRLKVLVGGQRARAS